MPTNWAMSQTVMNMMPMPMTRMRRLGATGLMESRIEIMDIIPPYWLIAMTDSRPRSRANTATQPKPLIRLSAADRKASTGVASGPAAAYMMDPSAKTHRPETALGRYVHQKVERTPTLAGR